MSCLFLFTMSVMVFEGPTEPVWLQWRFAPGQVLCYRQNEDQKIANDQGVTQRVSTNDWKLQVREVSHNRAVIALRMQRIRWTVRGGKESIQFDSQSAPTRGEPKEFASSRDAVGRDTVLIIDTNGASVAPTTADADPSLASIQATRFMEMLSSWMPRQSIEPSQSWSRQEKITTPIMGLSRINTLTVLPQTGDRWVVEASIDLRSLDIPDPQTDVRGNVVMQHPGSARMVFNHKRGLLESLTSKVAFDMNVVSSKQGQENAPRTLRQSLSSETQINLLPAEDLLGN